MKRQSYFAKRDLLAIDYLINEHPKREELFGGLAMEIPEATRSNLMQASRPEEAAKRNDPLVKAL